MIGSLLYLTTMRPDIQFSVSVHLFSGIAEDFTSAGRQSDVQVLRYTPELGLWYSASSSLSLLGFSDAYFAGSRVDQKSTLGT
jgi:hypothetical protein